MKKIILSLVAVVLVSFGGNAQVKPSELTTKDVAVYHNKLLAHYFSKGLHLQQDLTVGRLATNFEQYLNVGQTNVYTSVSNKEIKDVDYTYIVGELESAFKKQDKISAELKGIIIQATKDAYTLSNKENAEKTINNLIGYKSKNAEETVAIQTFGYTLINSYNFWTSVENENKGKFQTQGLSKGSKVIIADAVGAIVGGFAGLLIGAPILSAVASVLAQEYLPEKQISVGSDYSYWNKPVERVSGFDQFINLTQPVYIK